MGHNPLQADILNLFEYTRREITDFVIGLNANEKDAVGTPENWSAKDLLSNLAFWQDYMVERMGYYARGENAPRYVDFDALNTQAYLHYKDHSWAEVLSIGNHALEALIEAVKNFDDRQLSVSNTYDDLTSSPLWGEIIANGYLYPMEQIAKFYMEKGDEVNAKAVKQREIEQDALFDRYRSLGAFISPSELHRQQQASTPPIIIDVRSPDEYAAGHVVGAVNIPLADLTAKQSDLSVEQPIVTYCNMHHRGESRGEKAAALLGEKGYKAITLDGGFPAWEAAGLPIETSFHK